MNEYNREQFETLCMVHEHVEALTAVDKGVLLNRLADYLSFRDAVDSFLREYFSEICTRNCYQSRLSACCSREGIVTFFADVAINVLLSSPEEIVNLKNALQKPNSGFKCIYLGARGCLWRVKPIVCEMFLCDRARQTVFDGHSDLEERWEALTQRKKMFTWPDRPVLFDELEKYFIDMGCTSPLMYMHNSPGLIRVKRNSPDYFLKKAQTR